METQNTEPKSDELALAEEEAAETGGPDAEARNAELSSKEHLRRIRVPGSKFDVRSIFDPDGKEKKLIRARKSDFIHNLVYLDGKKFDFTGRDYLKQIYDAPYPHKLLVTGRQVEKSTMLANELITSSSVIPYFKSLYVTPSHSQTRQFSNGKLAPWMADSPVIQRYFVNTKVSQQVFERGFTNGSLIFLRSAFLSADRTRGISSDLLCLDEVQDILSSNVPIIMETLSHSKYGLKIFSGTPKTLDNTINEYWEMSSQCEWLVACERHTPVHWNYLDERSIGKTGPICNKCGQRIDPQKGRWVAFSNKTDIMGFRISQLMTPWFNTSEQKWKEIIWKYETYSKGPFFNEVLGLSYDSASKPITRAELMAICKTGEPLRADYDEWAQNHVSFMGVDWGTGADGNERDEKGRLKPASYTVVTIGTMVRPGVFMPYFFKRYRGDDALPSNCIRDIIRLARTFRVALVGVDWGFGWAANDQLEAALGNDKVIKWQYVGMQRERIRFDDVARKMTMNRTEVMSDFFHDLKRGKYQFPEFSQVEQYLKDIENIYAEVTLAGHLKYDHKKTEPDDAAHAIIFAREAADRYYGVVR